ncbi:protein eva-1 homolog C isoform X2 [Gouania willdenowi]|uniref:protein eva-1 homolog C isoform X2 n=1 Tax=Gouania willdenowi TaxID=441366 RepID=UPI001054CA6B|nr:protein eva-1 homolog C isoform X2 [Gouania willdenowi]
MRPCSGLIQILILIQILWTRRMDGLTDSSNYLSRIVTNHYTQACDGQPLHLHCPHHATIFIQSAFYGTGEFWLCRADAHRGNQNHSCSAFTALQLLSECQSHRQCQLPVNHLLFGEGPCPGTAKYLHVHYKCKPTEHKRHVVCEGETLVLRCKPPRVLNIHAAVYGPSPEQHDTCPPHVSRPPSFVCVNHEAVQLVTQACYSRHKCEVAVTNQTFRDPCFPGTRKYLSVVYSCVPRTLLREADLSSSDFTSFPPIDNGKVLEEPVLKGSSRPENSGTMMSNSLQTYAYIKEHPDMAALLFTSSMCIGLLLTLLAVSVRVTCRRRRLQNHRLVTEPGSQNERRRLGQDGDKEDSDEDDDDHDNVEAERSLISPANRKSVYEWEEVTYRSEEAERAERIERREMIIQEIRMNAYLNGNLC